MMKVTGTFSGNAKDRDATRIKVFAAETWPPEICWRKVPWLI
jgi:hypothetical protein